MSLSTEKATKQTGFHQDYGLLRDVSLLRGLEHECLNLLAMLCRRMEYSEGDQLVAQDEDNDCAFLLITGRLDALYQEGQNHHVISQLEPGQLVYGCALLGRVPPLFTLRAKENTTVLCLRREEFQKALQQFSTNIIRINDNLVSELVSWDRNLLKKQPQRSKFNYQTIGISLL